jgi:hypothetical protein
LLIFEYPEIQQPKPKPLPKHPTMASHSDKYLSKLLFGLGAVIASIFSIMYSSFERTKNGDWYFWGVVASVLMCTGLFLLLSAFVHKVKADFSRRQTIRKQQSSSSSED